MSEVTAGTTERDRDKAGGDSALRDPFQVFPDEILLQIFSFATPQSLASATRVSKTWHKFIDGPHQDMIYFRISDMKSSTRLWDLKNLLSRKQSLGDSYRGVTSWKQLLRQSTLHKNQWFTVMGYNMDEQRGLKATAFYEIDEQPGGWLLQMSPDFNRRIIVCEFRGGDIAVFDMDTLEKVWEIADNLAEGPPAAASYYSNGLLIQPIHHKHFRLWRWHPQSSDRSSGGFTFDGDLCLPSGILEFDFSETTMTLISQNASGEVTSQDSDLSPQFPILQQQLNLGYFDKSSFQLVVQNEEVIVYRLGQHEVFEDSLHFFDKFTNTYLGQLRPDLCGRKYHALLTREGGRDAPYRVSALELVPGFPDIGIRRRSLATPIKYDHWPVARLDGVQMAGLSYSRRLFICPNWRAALKSAEDFQASSSILETYCDTTRPLPYLWDVDKRMLSIKDNRVAFLARYHACIISLDQTGLPLSSGRPWDYSSWYVPATSSVRNVIRSLSVHDDCVMFGGHPWRVGPDILESLLPAGLVALGLP